MTDIVPLHTRLAPSSLAGIDKVRRLGEVLKALPQIPFITEHLLHAGMYTRTVRLPPDTVCAAVLIKLPTVLIIQGACRVYSDDELIEVTRLQRPAGQRGPQDRFRHPHRRCDVDDLPFDRHDGRRSTEAIHRRAHAARAAVESGRAPHPDHGRVR